MKLLIVLFNIKMSILVAYFSATGKTKKVAETISKEKNGTLYEIKPEQQYSSADLNWINWNSRSSKEMGDENSRPKIITGDLDISAYNEIYLGYPIWWHKAPRIINTFLESYDFKDKTIHLFATSGSSSIENSFESLKKTYPNLKIVDAKIESSCIIF